MDENDSLASGPPNETSGPDPSDTQSETSSATPNEAPKIEPPERTAAPPNDFRRELLIAIIQHGNRSIVILLISIMVAIGVLLARKELAGWLSNAESVKAFSFEVRLREGAKSKGLDTEFSKLANLNDEQLQLFLVLGKQRISKAAGEFSISYAGEELTRAKPL